MLLHVNMNESSTIQGVHEWISPLWVMSWRWIHMKGSDGYIQNMKPPQQYEDIRLVKESVRKKT
jgi:hypothetical protein